MPPPVLPSPLPLSDELLPLVSHELRTPLTAIQGYAELLSRRLRQRGAERELLSPLGIIGAQARRLGTMVDELLDLSELAQPQARLRATRVDMSEVVTTAAAQVGSQVPRPPLHVSAETPLLVRGDPVRLHQLVEHLLRNAVKFSPDDGAVDARVWAQDNTVMLMVADHGPGITPELLRQIFEPFYRNSPAEPQGLGGLGLGLTLCRFIAERHGGYIWADSTPGQGSTFYVRLPRADAPND